MPSANFGEMTPEYEIKKDPKAPHEANYLKLDSSKALKRSFYGNPDGTV